MPAEDTPYGRLATARRPHRRGVPPPPAARGLRPAARPWRRSCSCPARVPTRGTGTSSCPDSRRAGHDVVAVDLPCDDDTAGLRRVRRRRRRRDRRPARRRARRAVARRDSPRRWCASACRSTLMVLVAAMVPRPGESRRRVVGEHRAREAADPTRSDDPVEMFLHDVPAEVAAASRAPRARSSRARRSRSRGRSPRGPTCRPGSCSVATTASSPPSSSGGSCAERLGIEPDEMDGGHLPALARPQELAQRLLGYLDEIDHAPQ